MTQLLLVAGPSGCGKSAFIDQLRGGRASPDISSRLPCVVGWLQTSVKRLSAGRDRPDAAPGLIVHYDTMRPYQMGVDSYEADDALVSLLSQSSRATILTIKIAPDRLLNQYRARKARRPFLGFGLRNRAPLLSLYENQHDLAEWSAKWEMFCNALMRRREDVTLITIEPGAEKFAFNLVSGPLNKAVLAQNAHRPSEGANPPGLSPRGD
jgi:hypothetical protein